MVEPGADTHPPTDPRVLYLTRADLESLALGMAQVVDTIDAAFRATGRGAAALPPKASVHGEAGAFSQVMAAALPDGLGAKWVCLFPTNLRRGLPTLHGLLVLSDPETGVPQAVMDATLVTALRTGASAALAARYLGRHDTDCIGVLGCGVQGRSSVRALAAVLPALRVVRCHDLRPEAAAAFAAELQPELPGVEFRGCDRPAQVCHGAGVVVSAITMSEKVVPPLGAGLLEPGALAVALDYDAAWSSAAMAECDRFVVDDTAQVLATKAAGVRLAGIPARIHADLGELAAGAKVGRERPDERLFCMNLGVAIEDVAVGGLAYRRALECGRGRHLPL